MKSNDMQFFLLALFFAVVCLSCSGGSDSSSNPSPPPTPVPTQGKNVMTIAVSPESTNYYNEPVVSVTVCSPGTSTCQTINNILLDTGSVGLRLFNQVLTVPLTQVLSGSGSLAELYQYGDGSADWGPVQMASVILGSEPPVQIPIQIIDASFGTAPSGTYTYLDQDPNDSGYNGILGIGFFAQDCGEACVGSANVNNGLYYACSGSSCTNAAASLSSQQLQNPVASLAYDNNGVIIQLPSISTAGASTANGKLLLGIGTQSNNTPSSAVTALNLDENGNFITVFNGTSISSFIDTGSNFLFFPDFLLTTSVIQDDTFYCPAQLVSLLASMQGASGSPETSITFQIGNASALFETSCIAFNDIGAPGPTGLTGYFDWGVPFYFGRTVYFGMEGMSSSLGTGLYVAF